MAVELWLTKSLTCSVTLCVGGSGGGELVVWWRLALQNRGVVTREEVSLANHMDIHFGPFGNTGLVSTSYNKNLMTLLIK